MRQPKPTSAELLGAYANQDRGQPVRKFLEITGWREHPPRTGPPNWNDRNGRVIQGQKIWSLLGNDLPVRVLIPENADKEEVIILLQKITRRLRSGWWEELWNIMEERPIKEWGLDTETADKSIVALSRG